ncbi:hypothetical protein R0H03_04175 [Pediococcus acidilactici]|uniref:Rubrerythrin rubredoxin-like domain-containing protein n=1 Tax=Pediococcus acidilactici TaxID=1254 RepID=A0AAW8YKS7_PEDAC|nr:hypothetical protein [Pediococcus acidilactici]MDV2911063.1 hypothetical protein [Pediococcus acidilactici]WQS17613.1 hypothetical protein SGW14_00830 [Pediococcus acidilactici]
MKYRCNNCNFIFEGTPSNCPNCGAKIAYNVKQSNRLQKADSFSKGMQSFGDGLNSCGCALMLLPIVIVLLWMAFSF